MQLKIGIQSGNATFHSNFQRSFQLFNFGHLIFQKLEFLPNNPYSKLDRCPKSKCCTKRPLEIRVNTCKGKGFLPTVHPFVYKLD
mgnify:CR=1 FL=1